jgi:hypothetical protein
VKTTPKTLPEIMAGFKSARFTVTCPERRESLANGFVLGVRLFEQGSDPFSILMMQQGSDRDVGALVGYRWRAALNEQESRGEIVGPLKDPSNGGPGATMGDAVEAMPPVAASKAAEPDLCVCREGWSLFTGKDGATRCVACGKWSARCAVTTATPRTAATAAGELTAGVEATMAIAAPEPRVQADQPLNLADRSFATLSALTVLASNAPPPPAEWGNEITTPGEQPDRHASWAVAWATKLVARSELELAKRALAQSAASKAYGIKPANQPGAPKQQRLVVNIANLPLVRTGQGDYTVDFYG